MDSTTYDYDYDYDGDNTSGILATPATPCDRHNDNNLGAQLSILFYFMFLFSLFGNGLVLIIIYR